MAETQLFLFAVGATVLFGFLLLRKSQAWGFIDVPDERKVHSIPTPRTGGLAMIVGGASVLLAGVALGWTTLPKAPWQTWIAGIGFIGIGALDDRFSFRPRQKFLTFLLLSALAAWPWLPGAMSVWGPSSANAPVLHGLLMTAMAICLTLWFMSVPNAVNIEDAINGYMGGYTLIILLALSLKGLGAWIPLGALVGFLAFNWPKAKHFMGDAGSFGCGFILAEAILRGGGIANPFLALALTAPISMDVAMGLIRRRKLGMSPFEADKATCPHHLLNMMGGSPLKATPILWLNVVGFTLLAHHPALALVQAIVYAGALIYLNRGFLFPPGAGKPMPAAPLVCYVRSLPLNVTPAVGRYFNHLAKAGFRGSADGIEYNFQEDNKRDSIKFRNIHSFIRNYATTRERVYGLIIWQFYLIRTLNKMRPNVIQFSDVFSSIPSLFMKWLTGAKLIYDIRDNIGLSFQHRSAFISHLVQGIEDFAASHSEAVVTVSEPLRDVLPARARAKTFVIPNAPATDLYSGPHFSQGRTIQVNIAGFVSHRRNLEAYCQLAQINPLVSLDLYGSIADGLTQSILDRFGRSEVKTIGHAESMERMSKADVVSLMYDPAIAINAYAAPNKFYESLMLGKPIVCARGMRMAADLKQYDCGIEADYGDVKSLTEAMTILEDPETRARMGRNARRLFEVKYLGATEREMNSLYQFVGLLPTVDAQVRGAR